MVRRRAQRAVSNHGNKFDLAAILRDALAPLGLLRMRSVKEAPMIQRNAGAVEGMPRLLLRLEGAALAIAAVYVFHRMGANWWWFALILAPDISMAAYFFGTVQQPIETPASLPKRPPPTKLLPMQALATGCSPTMRGCRLPVSNWIRRAGRTCRIGSTIWPPTEIRGGRARASCWDWRR